MKSKRTFVGFGFGPIQSALFLYEAAQSGNFGRFVVADVDGELIEAVRGNGGRYTVNIARSDRIDRAVVEGVELYNSREPEDSRRLIEAVASSDEMCTALPSVDVYSAGGEASVVQLLARGLGERAAATREKLPTIIYTAENNNRAAQILADHLQPHISASIHKNVQILNTVIGKMSGVITDRQTVEKLGLATITPRIPRAVLVEEFNRILVSKVSLPGCRRGISVFQEKEDLLPFEEAKLYGHNAIHALIAYLADFKGYRLISEAGRDSWIMETARRAFIEESGAALIRRHRDLGDLLFTETGYRAYAEDLLERMINPNLNDLVERVGRDPARKLAIEDRLYGTMVIALEQGIEPRNLAVGAAAGVIALLKSGESSGSAAGVASGAAPGAAVARRLDEERLRGILRELWGESPSVERHGGKLIALTWDGVEQLGDLGLSK